MFFDVRAISSFEYWTGANAFLLCLGCGHITVSDMEGYDSERESLQNESPDASPEFRTLQSDLIHVDRWHIYSSHHTMILL